MPYEKTLSLQDLSYEDLSFISQDWNFPKFRIDQVYISGMQNKEYDEMTNIPKVLLEKLKERFYATAVKIVQTFSSSDGTEKYLFKLNDGNIIEGVFMRHNYGNTLCVSTQVGCRMNCSFCASGLHGLVRNLSSGEILGQVLTVNALKGGTLKTRSITNIVLMGSGEPLDNFENVIKFLKDVSSPKGINISLRNISLSTCGLVDKIIQLADMDLPVTLTISLHSADDKTRSELMPVNKKHNIASLIEAAKYYFNKTGRRIIFEYSLIHGENCDTASALRLANLLRGLACHVNLINLNYVKERNMRGVKGDEIKEFMDTLTKENISNTLRRSMGNDIEGACGQLRNKYEEENKY